MTSKTYNPDFQKVDLLALYATMYLKRIVLEKLPWKLHLNILYEEVKQNVKQLGKEKEADLFSCLREFARIYQNQFIVRDDDAFANVELYFSLLVVLALWLGLDQLWIPDCRYLREDVIVEGLLIQKSKLKLTHLSQGESLYDMILPHCPNLQHLSIPFSDNLQFTKAVGIKSLRVLEFATGVSDKVLCFALWNIDKKSDKVLQIAIKNNKEGGCSLALPHLEVLRSNIQMNKNGGGSMRITLGAAALALQPKLRIVENRLFWSTLQAIQMLIEFEKKFKFKHERRLAVDRLLIKDLKFSDDFLASSLPLILQMCPAISSVNFTLSSMRLTSEEIFSSVQIFQKKLSTLKHLSIDATCFVIEDFWIFLFNIEPNLRTLTLRINLSLLNEFQAQKRKNYDSYLDLLATKRNVETLSLIFSEKEDAKNYEEESDFEEQAVISFLMCLPCLKSLNYFNLYYLPSSFAVYSCIGGVLACATLHHLSINGCVAAFFGSSYFPTRRMEINEQLPSLLHNSTFNVLIKLKTFTLDTFFLCPRVDRLLEMLRASGVHIRVLYNPITKKGLDPSMYFDYNEFVEIYGLDGVGDSLF